MADSMSSRVKKTGVNVIGSALKICKMAFREQCPHPVAAYHPCSPEALYCSKSCMDPHPESHLSPCMGTGMWNRNISHLLLLIHLILFRWICTEKGWDCFPWSVAVGREMNIKSCLRLECCAASDRDDLFPKQVWCWAQARDWTKPSSKGLIYLEDNSHGMENFLDEEQNAQHRISHFLRN